MFNLDDYIVFLDENFSDLVSMGFDKFYIDGWCIGQMHSLNFMYKSDLISISDINVLFNHIKSYKDLY